MMPTRDAVNTCILSKRWRQTWASTSALRYNCNFETPKQFSKFVNKTLILHKSSTVKKFVVKSGFKKLPELSVNLWVQAAVIKRVEDLRIKLYENQYTCPVLSQTLYSCDSLRKLSLMNCLIPPIYSCVCWRSLKHLSLTSVKLEDDMIQKLLTGSPLLESLKLIRCEGFNRINIHSDKVRRLVINVYPSDDVQDHNCLEIIAPHLESLEITGSMHNMKSKLEDVRSLSRASLTFYMSCFDECYKEYDDYQRELDDRVKMARDLMKKVAHVRNLTLGVWIVQALSTSEVKHIPPCLGSKQNKIILDISLYGYEYPGIARLLRTSSMLEILVIDISTPEGWQKLFEEQPYFGDEKYWASKDMELKYLRTVEFIGFSHTVIEFAEFLLRNAIALEMMIFTPVKGSHDIRWQHRWQHYFSRRRDFFEIMQKLLSLPRSSPRPE